MKSIALSRRPGLLGLLCLTVYLLALMPSMTLGEPIDLTLHSRGQHHEHLHWPITFGVPFPQGHLQDEQTLRLLDPDGQPVPIQTKVTGRWFDGSIRWVLIDATVALSQQQAKFQLTTNASAAASEAQPRVRVQQQADQLLVDTGLLRVAFDTASLRVFRSVQVRHGQTWHEAMPAEQTDAAADLYLEDHNGVAYRGSWATEPEVVVEETGPNRVAVKLEGWMQSQAGDRLGRRIVRVYAYANQRHLDVFDTFVKTADSEQVQYRNIALHLPFAGNTYHFHASGDDQPRQVREQAYLLQHKHDAYQHVEDGQIIHTGDRAAGSVTVSTGPTAYTVTRRHFWQMFPAEFQVQPGLLKLHLWPRHGRPAEHLGDQMTEKNLGHLWWVHEGERLDFRIPEEFYNFSYGGREDNIREARNANALGVARTVDYQIHFNGQADPLPHAQAFHAQPRMVVDPHWMADSGAFWNIAARSELYAEMEDALERTIEFLPAMYERIGDYGLWNFGAYHQSYLPELDGARLHRIWKGFHHGGARWPWLIYARSGQPEHLDFAEIHARHLLDVGVANWQDDEYNARHANENVWWGHNFRLKYLGGLNRYKGIVHWYGGQRMFYNSIADFALWHYYLTGYQRAWDVAMNMGEFLLKLDRETYRENRLSVYGDRSGMARGAMAITLYRETHDPRYLKLAQLQMQRFQQLADEDPNRHGVNHIFYAPFIERYWQVTGDEAAKPYLLRWIQQRRGPGAWTSLHEPKTPEFDRHENDWSHAGFVWHSRDQFFNHMALGYQLTGDVSYLIHGLAQARVLLDNVGTGADPILQGVLLSDYAGGPGYAGQQWGDFVRALHQHEAKT